jgi:hypothetical protein
MIPRITRSNLLLIKGLSPSEFEVKIERVEFDPDDTYMELPTIFRGVESWPKSTNLLCWTCDGKVTGYPKFMPSDPKVEDGVDICRPNGNFCRWRCVQSYIDHYMPVHLRSDASSLLCKFASKFNTEKTKQVIKFASSEPKFIMKIYCGPGGITREEYDSRCDNMLDIEL